jgi:hypothetical protein
MNDSKSDQGASSKNGRGLSFMDKIAVKTPVQDLEMNIENDKLP